MALPLLNLQSFNIEVFQHHREVAMEVRSPMLSGMPGAWGIDALPTEEAGRLVFEHVSGFKRQASNWRDHLADGRMRLLAFRQTLGLIGVFRGVKVYRMEYEVLALAHVAISVDQFYGTFVLEKGQQLADRGTLTFELTEQGWRGEDGELY
jgi:hypothetical protein